MPRGRKSIRRFCRLFGAVPGRSRPGGGDYFAAGREKTPAQAFAGDGRSSWNFSIR